MALIYVDGEFIDDGTGSQPQQQQSQGPSYQDGEWLGAGSYASPPPNLYTPSFDYNPETPFNPNDYSQFNSWFNQQPDQGSQWDQSNYNYGQQAQQPANLFTPADYSGYADSTNDTGQPSNLSTPGFKSDGSVADFYQTESYNPPAKDAFGRPLSQIGQSAYNQWNQESQGNGASWGVPDNGDSGSFGYGGDWNNAGSVADFYNQESQANQPPPKSDNGPFGFVGDAWNFLNGKVGKNYDPTFTNAQTGLPDTSNGLDRIEQAGQNVIAGMAGPLSIFGSGVDQAADSNIPFLNTAAGAVRNAWEQVVEPVGNIGSALVGDMAAGRGGPYSGFTNPLGLKGQTATEKIGDSVSSIWDPQKAQQLNDWRQQQMQAEYANQIAAGKTPDEANAAATRLGTKLVNPLNYAEYQGMQDFSKLPAPVQLAVMFGDPIGNAVYGAALKPLTHGLPTAIGQAADATGLTDVARALDEKLLQAPVQKDYKAGLQAENLFNQLNQISDEFQIPAPDLARSFLKDTTSPLYYGNLVQDPQKIAVAKQWERLYDADPNAVPDLTNGKPLLEGGKTLPQNENQLGVMAQDTSGTVDPNASNATGKIFNPAEPGAVDPKQTLINEKLQPEFDAISPANKPAATTAANLPLPDKYAGIKIPDRNAAGLDEWFGAVRTMQGVDTGALKLDNTLAKPGYRNAKPLEEWGVIGKALRGANSFTQATVARPFLNTFSRGVIRDPASNEAKLLVTRPELIAEQVKKVFGKSQVNAQAEKLYGKGLTLGPSSITEGSGAKSGKANPIAELYYVVANPYNELSAKALKKATGGKFQDWNVYSERREANVKELLYNKVRLEVGDRLAKEAAQTEFFKSNPEMYKQFIQGKIDTADIEKALSGKHFEGFDLNDARNKTYNPANTSKEFDEKWDKVLSGQAGIYGNIVYKAASSLTDRVKAENQRKIVQYLKDSGYRVPADGDLSKIKPSVLKNAQANAGLVKLSEVVPGHPIYEKMIGDAVDALDAARFSMFPNDTRLYDASYYLANSALNYAADSGRYDLFTRAFKDYVASKEAEYAVKYKAPPTDFERMMTLKDKYESGAKMTPQQRAEYEAWRDKQPLRQMAADSGVELPAQNESVFSGAKSLEDYQKTLRQAENFKSAEYDEFGGTPLTVTHQKQLAQALYDKDYKAFQQLISEIKTDPRYSEGVAGSGKGKGTGVYVDRTKANTDRTINRLEQYWKDANAVDNTGSPGLPQATPPPATGYADLSSRVNNPPNVRLNVGKKNGRATNGQVLTPDAMQKIAKGFTRKEKVNSKGETFVAPVSRVQMNRYLHDFLATDQYYRKITNNEFGLDPDYLVPVRFSDGMTLNELTGQPLPPRIGPEVPSLKDVPFEYLGETLKQRYGEDVYKQDFSKMDPALRYTIIREIGQEYFGVDPLSPVVDPKGSAEHARSIEMLSDLTDDAKKRFDETKATKEELAQRQASYDADMKSTVETLAAERARIGLQVNDEAYKLVKGSFFDYRDKNRLDQALGSILPFQYWARQNFAYLARHFSANPYHFAAVLNFYQTLEKENSDPTIPGYQKAGILMLDVPGGQHLTLTPSSYLPINPLGNDSAFGGLALMTDDELAAANTKLANSQPLGIFNNPGEFLFGKDVTSKNVIDPKTGKPKVVGRDKGLLPNWVSVNPFVKDALLQSGVANKWWQNLGLLGKDQTTLGQDYPEDTRGQHGSVSFFPAQQLYASTAAATPVGQALRGAGITKGEFNPVGPINEMLYGRNAGKPQTAIYQEVNRMVANGEISAEDGKKAIAAYKDGSYSSVPLLAAIDRVYAENLAMKVASQVGFSGMLTNTPRQQQTNKLYDAQGKAYDQLPTGYKLDEKGNAVANPSAVSKFYNDNPAAKVLSTEQSNDTPETIRQSLLDDKTYKAITDLKAQRKDGTLDYATYTAELNKLQGANPDFFDKNPYYKVTPGEAKYQQLVDQYKAIGGQNFDDLQAKANEAKAKGDEAAYKAIVSSPDYKTASSQRLEFMLQNPGFQKQYAAANDQYAREKTQELVGGAGRTNPQLAPKPQRTVEDLQYTKTTNDYYDIGGDKFDKLQTDAYAAKDKGDDATYKKIVTSPEYQDAQKKRNEFIFDNPDWYSQYSQGVVDRNKGKVAAAAEGIGGLARTDSKFQPKAPKSIPDIKYAQTLSEYYAKGGNDFDQLQAQAQDYFNKGQDAKAYDIINSRDYQQVKAAQNQFKKDNPDFAKRYDAEYTAKYGKPPKSEADQVYDEQKAAYYKIGGADFDQTQKKINDLFDAGKDALAYELMKDPNYKRVTANQDQFKIDNPDFAKRFDAEYTTKYGKAPKSLADKQYDDLKGQYADIGRSGYDAMSKMISDYMDAGDKKSAGVILGSAAYKQAKAARDQFLADNPDFAARYKAENEAKYGPTKTSTSASVTPKATTTAYSTSYSSKTSSYTPKKTSTSYKPSYSNSNTSAATKAAAGNSSSGSTPFTKAQSAAYGYARGTLGYTAAQAAGYAKKIPATQTTFYKPGTSKTTVNSGNQFVDSTKYSTYNNSKSSVKTTPTSTSNTYKSVASLPPPVRTSSGGGGGSKRTPSVPIHKFLPGPNASLIRFAKRKRYK